MNKNKRSVALVVLLVLSLLAGGVQRPVAAIPTALPASPVDESKVPHYYGPYPNWALSPLTTADVAVEIVGDGSGATASATVGANGALTGIQITNPGRGYTTASVNIIGAGIHVSEINIEIALTDGGQTGYVKVKPQPGC